MFLLYFPMLQTSYPSWFFFYPSVSLVLKFIINLIYNLFMKIIMNYLNYLGLLLLFSISFTVWRFFFFQISALNKDNANSFGIFQVLSKTQRTQLNFFSENFSFFFFFINLFSLTFTVAWQHIVSLVSFFLKMYFHILEPQLKIRQKGTGKRSY